MGCIIRNGKKLRQIGGYDYAVFNTAQVISRNPAPALVTTRLIREQEFVISEWHDTVQPAADPTDPDTYGTSLISVNPTDFIQAELYPTPVTYRIEMRLGEGGPGALLLEETVDGHSLTIYGFRFRRGEGF